MRYFLFLMLSVSIFACKEEVYDVSDVESGEEYFPLEVGKSWVYQVDSMTFKPGASSTIVNSSTTFVQEEIVSMAENNIGDTIYVIERSEKLALSDEWEIKDVWQAGFTGNRAERTEENLKYIKMLFPLRVGTNFDATRFIDEETDIIVVGETITPFKNWNSEVESVGETETIGSFDYPEVATIIYADDENLLERRFASAKFAKGIGLVYAYEEIMDTQCLAECAEDPWEDKAEKGYIMTQTLISFQ